MIAEEALVEIVFGDAGWVTSLRVNTDAYCVRAMVLAARSYMALSRHAE